MSSSQQPIGIFDSGLGGISVLKQLKTHMPNEDFLYYGDSAYAPYGIKDKEEIINRCLFICDFFIQHNVKAIVIACNTATSVAAATLRERYDIPIIGMEPALKVAAYDKSAQNIIVMATPLTLKEKKFNLLMSHYSNDNHITKMPCPELVKIVENDELDNKEKVVNQLYTYYRNVNIKEVDSIVLGCTHFVFYRPYFKQLFPHIQIIDGNEGTANHLWHILKGSDSLNTQVEGKIKIYNSSEHPSFITLSEKLLEKEI